jgi:hypothetical protein
MENSMSVRRSNPFVTILLAITLAIPFAACSKSEAAKSQSAGAGVPDVPAQVPDVKGQSDDADVREMSRYKLTMEAVKKFKKADANLDRVKEKYPEKVAELEAENENVEEGGLDEIERVFESFAPARAALEDAGLNAREYVTIVYVLMMASMTHMAISAGANPQEVMKSSDVLPANVEFVKQHEKELEALDLFSKK